MSLSANQMREYCRDTGIGEIPIIGLDRHKAQLLGANGRRYEEISESIWACTCESNVNVVYLQTMTHGGGICLRPLFAEHLGTWRNVTTGRQAPRSLNLQHRVCCIGAANPE